MKFTHELVEKIIHDAQDKSTGAQGQSTRKAAGKVSNLQKAKSDMKDMSHDNSFLENSLALFY